MKLFLAGVPPWRDKGIYDAATIKYKPFILESFYYVDKDTERLLPHYGDFLLDSGAFTYMQKTDTCGDWDEYIERYADFINRNGVEKFFELDIDNVIGYDKVKKLRRRLEKLTGRQVIPVWHINRGKSEFERMCNEYGYVAIGGLVNDMGQEYASKYWKYFPWFIRKAHSSGAKIHALGFTSLKGVEKYHFDSVDSTAWTTGNRFGYIYRFDGRTMQKVDAPAGARIGQYRRAAVINYLEWIKFQKYAELHL